MSKLRSDYKNEEGNRYGKLAVGKPIKSGRNLKWNCICDCGNTTIVQGSHLRAGYTISCGCCNPRKTHGMSNTRVWNIYNNMVQRCTNHNEPAYKNYGGRGIKCLWDSFEEFYKDMKNGYTDKLTIERINNNGHYCKDNCCWADRNTQANNTRRNIYIKYNGKKQTVAEWCAELDLNYWTVIRRIYRGWNTIKAITTPIKIGNYK